MNILKFDVDKTNSGLDYITKYFYMYSVVYTRNNNILPESVPSVAFYVDKKYGKLSKKAFFCRKNIKLDKFKESVEKHKLKSNIYPIFYNVSCRNDVHLVPYMIASNDNDYIYVFTYAYDSNNEMYSNKN